MTRREWSAPIDWGTVRARANGCRRWVATVRFRAKVRRMQVRSRLYEIRHDAFAKGVVARWTPRGAIAQLAEEFHVGYSTMRRDVAAIEREDLAALERQPPPPRKRLKDPRFAWAWTGGRPRVLTRRVTLRLPEELYQRLKAAGDVSLILRKALAAFLDTGTSHEREDCAKVLLQHCEPGTADTIAIKAEALRLSVAEVMTSLLLIALRPPRTPSG
jgi:hypothetical protein